MENLHPKNRKRNRRTWLIADTHFGHAKILDYEARPWGNISDHDEALVENWNSVVSEGDTVWHLGDFVLVQRSPEQVAQDILNGISGTQNQAAHIASILPRLNGRKRIVCGNHDRGRSATWWVNAGFREAIKYPRAVIVDGYILSHEPQADIGNFRNIHGHLHSGSSEHRGGLWNATTHQCVSVEQIDFRPILWDEVVGRFEGG